MTPQRLEDLNLAVKPDGNPLADPAVRVGPVDVYFRDIADHLCDFVQRSDGVVGCVAWITHPEVLESLAGCGGVSLVLNKEDFLRPDSLTANGRQVDQWHQQMTGILRQHHEPVKTLCFDGDGRTEPLRCVGAGGSRSRRVPPLLHHKFLVRLMRGYRRWEWIPTAVWTGSFNPTLNGAASLENAVVIRNKKIAEAFYWEWGQALAISEPLNWESPWVAPEYRIGS